MADEPLDPFAPPGGDEALDLALEIEKPKKRPANQTVAPPGPEPAAPPPRGKSAERPAPHQPEAPEYKAAREGMSDEPLDPFAPPSGDAALDLALEIEKPKKRPVSQTVAPPGPESDAQLPRGKSAERPAPPAAKPREDERSSVSGLHRQPEAPEYKAPREGMSNLMLWGFAGLGVLAVIGSAIRFLRSSPTDSAVMAAAAPSASPTVWKPVELGTNVLVTIDVSPRSARLLLDGEPLDSNPVALTRGTKHTIGALADGFEGGLQDVVADRKKTVRIVLHPSRKRR